MEQLKREGLSLIIFKGRKKLFESSGDGIKPLFDAIEQVGLTGLKGCIVVDKIVGKAAALIVNYFKAKEVHCAILSLRGREILEKTGIRYYSEKIIPEVMNKTGTDICPFEETVLDLNEPKEGYERLCTKLKSLIEGNQF